MKRHILAGFLSVVAGLNQASAQFIPMPTPTDAPPVSGVIIHETVVEPTVVEPSVVVSEDFGTAARKACRPRVWGGVEYLLWFVKDAPVDIPILTQGDPALIPPGGIPGTAGTNVLYGVRPQDYDPMHGGRLNAGVWLNDRIGVQGSFFVLSQEHNRVTRGNQGDQPGTALFIPFNDVNPAAPGPNSQILAQPFNGGFSSAGVFQGTTSIRFYGADLNGAFNLFRGSRLTVDVLAGLRYYNLEETLSLTYDRTDSDGLFAFQASDNFSTRNRFFGGQVGARAEYQAGRFSVAATGLVAMGNNRQTIYVSGRSNVSGAAALVQGEFQGGIFTQPSNIGTFERDEFVAIPSLQVTAGVQVTKWLRATVGYDFISWADVVRPGSQLDSSVNSSQSGLLNPAGGTPALVGEARPRMPFNDSDFWAHGLSFGFELRY